MPTSSTRAEIVVITMTAGVTKQIAFAGGRVIVPFPDLLIALIADLHRQ